MRLIHGLYRLMSRAVHRRRLRAAITELAEQVQYIEGGDLFAGFRCVEIDSLAALFALAGEREAAAFVIARHAEHDDDDSGDRHAHLRDLIDRHGPRAGEVVHAADLYAVALIPAA
jgi:hypothetical protein